MAVTCVTESPSRNFITNYMGNINHFSVLMFYILNNTEYYYFLMFFNWKHKKYIFNSFILMNLNLKILFIDCFAFSFS